MQKTGKIVILEDSQSQWEYNKLVYQLTKNMATVYGRNWAKKANLVPKMSEFSKI